MGGHRKLKRCVMQPGLLLGRIDPGGIAQLLDQRLPIVWDVSMQRMEYGQDIAFKGGDSACGVVDRFRIGDRDVWRLIIE